MEGLRSIVGQSVQAQRSRVPQGGARAGQAPGDTCDTRAGATRQVDSGHALCSFESLLDQHQTARTRARRQRQRQGPVLGTGTLCDQNLETRL